MSFYLLAVLSSIFELIYLCKLYLRLCFLLKTLRKKSARRVIFRRDSDMMEDT